MVDLSAGGRFELGLVEQAKPASVWLAPDDLRTGAGPVLDMALIGTATATPDGLDALTIISERLVVAVSNP